MIEPKDVDRLVELTKYGELTWRQTGNGEATAEDAVLCRWTLLSGDATLVRVGLNPGDVEHGGMSSSSERYITTILAPVVNSMLLPAVTTPERAPRRQRGSSPAASAARKRAPSDTAAVEQSAKLGRVDESQLQMMETTTRRSDPA